MVAKKRKKRTLSAAQKAALAKGRKKLAAKKHVRKPRRKQTSLGAELKPLLLTEGTKMATRTRKRKTTRKKVSHRRYGEDFGFEGKRKRTRRHVRRYSGAGRGGKLDIMKPLISSGIAVAGGVAGSFIANKLPVAPKLKAALPLVLGLVLDISKAGRKNPMVQAAATGMMVVGGLALARQFFPTAPLLAGEEEVSMIDTSVDPTLLGAPVDLSGEEFNFSADDDEYVSPADL